MPVPSLGHAATSPHSSQSREMDSRGATSRLLEEPPPVSDQTRLSRSGLAMTTKPGGIASKELDKKSLEYILRSGLAGGLAGCAVCALRQHSYE
jgi:hypothetical protein